MKYIFNLKDIPDEKLPLTGGKARSLAYMIGEKKLSVPEGYVITSEAFADGKIKEDADKELRALLPALNTEYTYAVRSSAMRLVRVVTRILFPFAVSLLISPTRSSTWPATGRTSMAGSSSPVGLMICSVRRSSCSLS